MRKREDGKSQVRPRVIIPCLVDRCHVSESVSLSETEDEKASELQNEEVDVERWELPAKLKHCKATVSNHSRCAMYEAVVESVHSQVCAFAAARVGYGWKQIHNGLDPNGVR